MEDVIFAGTEHRKPLGFAEVTIVLDNSDSTLPIDYEEVAITRRVYRSGESEYLINKTNCRLKDITELLLDTGIGRDGYSVIGQGRIDEILSTRSEDRRQIFEEASGIMKYKVRKHDAEKKLELTRQNLERINDIIAELESQLEPLREQSEKARRFLDLREELKVLEVNVYLDSMKKFRDRLEVMDKQLKTVQDQINDENNKLDEITRSNKEKTDLLKTMDERLEEAKQLFYEMEGNLERCSSEIKLNQEKIANLMQNIERLDTEKAELREKIEVLETEEAGKKDRLKYLERQLEEYSAKLAGYEKQMEELLKTLDEEERSIELLKSEIMDKMDIQSDKKLQISNLRSHIENMQKRQRSIDTEVYQNVVEKDREKMKKEELTESIRNAEQHIKGHKEKLSGLFREREETDKMLSELRMKQAKINSDIQSKSSRVRTLREMEQKLEGYNRSVREVLQACHASPQFGRGIHGALAQLIEVDRKYETAIEISLGGALQNIVTQTEEDAKKAIEFLKKNKLGRATFLPIRSVEGRGFDNQTMARIKQCEGFCGVASELVSHDSVYTGIIRNLLGKVVVIDNLDNGIKMARKFRYSFRIVTLDGDLLNTGGAMSGGSLENRGTGILTRNREISELDEELKSLRQQETGVSKDIKQLTEDISRIDSDISSIENEIKNNELVKIRDESHLAQTDENLEKLTARMEMLRQEKEQLEREIKETGNELTKYELELLQIEEEISEAKKTVAEFQEKHKEDQAARDALHTDITDYKISVNSIKESIAGVNESSDRIHTEKENMVMSITKKESEQERFREEIKKLEEQIEGLNARIKKHSEERSGRSFEIDRLTEERKILEEDIYDIVNKINDTNKTILLLQEEYSRTEVRKTRLEAEMEALQDRIWNEYELTYSSAMELKKDVGSLTSAQRRINEIKNMIKELGPINVAAIDDYIKTKDRYEFMTNQRNDMEQAREKLLRVIAEMTSIMKKQFLEQFKLINKNFNDVFRELFNGGRASLTLVDEENVLESGIEIEAQPPGKKLQNMMLLSGGERAFTAIALLFAILRLKPSPFCVLDEIEAALDEANVYRFVEYLKNYSCNTQFIVVTHRKGTMEGSDMLYGVTMQEHGVSKIISMKMGEKVG
ncbi:MAG: chromosome segregation protein SMC, partial [Clostridiaceae bacterium]|nr:chromosome segregation protein SMC [Clostridiaceae bacterium]